MVGRKKLVIGASGFLGSHVTRRLVDRGDDVRVLLRRTSSTRAIDDLDVERHDGEVFDDEVFDDEVFDDEALCTAMAGVDGPGHVLDAAADANLHRFVFTSSIGTIGVRHDGRPATEDDEMNWADKGGGYIRSLVAAENLVFAAARGRARA